MLYLFFTILGFALGSTLFAYWTPKIIRHIDIRELPADHNPGVANAFMLMPVMQFNKSCCSKKFAEVYDAVGGTGAGTDTEKADWVINQMDAMVKHLDIPTSLQPYGVTETDLPLLVKAGMDVQRLLVNNPRTVTAADAEALYRAIL